MNKKHLLIMLAGCLIPVAALTAILVFRVPMNAVVYLGLLLLCPALHLLMLKDMGHSHVGHDHSSHGPSLITEKK